MPRPRPLLAAIQELPDDSQVPSTCAMQEVTEPSLVQGQSTVMQADALVKSLEEQVHKQQQQIQMLEEQSRVLTCILPFVRDRAMTEPQRSGIKVEDATCDVSADEDLMCSPVQFAEKVLLVSNFGKREATWPLSKSELRKDVAGHGKHDDYFMAEPEPEQCARESLHRDGHMLVEHPGDMDDYKNSSGDDCRSSSSSSASSTSSTYSSVDLDTDSSDSEAESDTISKSKLPSLALSFPLAAIPEEAADEIEQVPICLSGNTSKDAFRICRSDSATEMDDDDIVFYAENMHHSCVKAHRAPGCSDDSGNDPLFVPDEFVHKENSIDYHAEVMHHSCIKTHRGPGCPDDSDNDLPFAPDERVHNDLPVADEHTPVWLLRPVHKTIASI